MKIGIETLFLMCLIINVKGQFGNEFEFSADDDVSPYCERGDDSPCI